MWLLLLHNILYWLCLLSLAPLLVLPLSLPPVWRTQPLSLSSLALYYQSPVPWYVCARLITIDIYSIVFALDDTCHSPLLLSALDISHWGVCHITNTLVSHNRPSQYICHSVYTPQWKTIRDHPLDHFCTGEPAPTCRATHQFALNAVNLLNFWHTTKSGPVHQRPL